MVASPAVDSAGRQGLLLRRPGHLLPAGRRLVHRCLADRSACGPRTRQGNRRQAREDHECRYGDPLRAGRPIRIVGLHRPRQSLRPGAVDGQRRRLLRQLDDRVTLVSHAGRTTRPKEVEDPRIEFANAMFDSPRSSTPSAAVTANSAGSNRSSLSATAPSSWHEVQESRLHRTRGRPKPPDIPGRFRD